MWSLRAPESGGTVRLQPEEERPRPRRAGDLSREGGKRAVAGALPGEAVIEHQHLIGSAPPFSNQAGSGFQFETSTPPDLCGLVELLRNVAELALPLRAEAAEGDFLHPLCDGSYQQLAAEMRGCMDASAL